MVMTKNPERKIPLGCPDLRREGMIQRDIESLSRGPN